MYKIGCGEIWGGIRGTDVAACSSGVEASLFSSACDGGEGGDVYYFSVCDGDLLTRIALVDVAGHGPAVTDISEWVFESLRSRMNDLSSNAVLADLSSLALEKGYRAISTAAIAAFYREDSSLMFSYAGHHPALIRKSSSDQWISASLPRTESPENLPLGVSSEAPYSQGKIALEQGDQIVLYTDGVIDAPSPSGDRFGMDRLNQVLESTRGGPVDIKDTLLGAMTEFTQGELSHDDVTFIVLEIK